MAAKCNIILSVVNRLESIQYGVEHTEQNKIVENYIEYLACPTVDLTICNNSDCVNVPDIFNCYFVIGNIKKAIVLNQPLDEIAFTLEDKYIKDNYTYLWSFNTIIFEATHGIDKPILSLRSKNGATVLNYTVTKLTLTVMDEEECVNTKICYYNKIFGMKCLGYSPCENNDNLIVNMLQSVCEANVALQAIPILL